MIKTAHIVIFKDGKVLGVSRKDDHTDFGLPGGKMEDSDMGNPEFTAIRECKEETGIDAKFMSMIGFRHMHGFRFGTSDIYFLCILQVIDENQPINRQLEEIADCKWLDFQKNDLMFFLH